MQLSTGYMVKNIRKSTKWEKWFWETAWDVTQYLFDTPILGEIVRFIYWQRWMVKKLMNRIPKDLNSIEALPFWLCLAVALFLFAYTFAFWLGLFCILVFGYGIRRLRGILRVKVTK